MNKIIEKLREIFYRFKKDKPLLPVKDTNGANKRDEEEFRKSLEVKDEIEIFNIQNKYERGEIPEEKLTPFQVLDLIDLYKKQVDDLDKKISTKKAKLNE